jgi:hypothetical protein
MAGLRIIFVALALGWLGFTAPAMADFNDGLTAYNRGDYPAAFGEWFVLAAQGNASAQYNLGFLYEFGQGTPKNLAEAVKWYRRSAKLGNPAAQKALGLLYDIGQGVELDHAEAVRWYREAANQDFAEAQFNLGMSYARGEGVAPDPVEAFFWVRLAAAKGVVGTSTVVPLIRQILEPAQIAEVNARVAAWQAATRAPVAPTDTTEPVIVAEDGLETMTDEVVLAGRITDDNTIAEFSINGQAVAVTAGGQFSVAWYVPLGGLTAEMEAIDEFGNRGKRTIQVARVQGGAEVAFKFDALNPTAQSVPENPNAVAIIIGVEGYEFLPNATYARRDAQFFYDFARRALGVPAPNIRLMVDDQATALELVRVFQQWLPAIVRAGESDVYVFFAGHGLATSDGNSMFLIPNDGAADLLERSALRRQEVFDWLQDSDARSVTVFLDTCFSGGTRGEEMLVADRRGFGLSAQQDKVPTRFTLITAATGDQTSTSLPEAQQGLFSYFLMKGMEGAADANNDRQITAGELHAFVAENIARQAPRLATDQTPQITGDEDRVLVAW